MDAYVMIQSEVGRAGEVSREIRMLPFTRSVDVVSGPFDVIHRLLAPSREELRERTRLVEGIPRVTRTVTCILGPLPSTAVVDTESLFALGVPA